MLTACFRLPRYWPNTFNRVVTVYASPRKQNGKRTSRRNRIPICIKNNVLNNNLSSRSHDGRYDLSPTIDEPLSNETQKKVKKKNNKQGKSLIILSKESWRKIDVFFLFVRLY